MVSTESRTADFMYLISMSWESVFLAVTSSTFYDFFEAFLLVGRFGSWQQTCREGSENASIIYVICALKIECN